MELTTITNKASVEALKIDEARRAAQEREATIQKISSIRRELTDRQSPLISSAKEIVGLSPRKEKIRGYDDRFRTSPLIKVGTLEDGKGLYIAVREKYESTSQDIDGYPTWKGTKLNRWEFVGVVGSRVGKGEFQTYAGQNDHPEYLGETIDGEGMYGRIVSTERLYPEVEYFSTLERAQSARESMLENYSNIEETLSLIRQGLESDELNPALNK